MVSSYFVNNIIRGMKNITSGPDVSKFRKLFPNIFFSTSLRIFGHFFGMDDGTLEWYPGYRIQHIQTAEK